MSGAGIHNSLLFTGVRVNSYTHIDRAVILPYSSIGRGARLRNCVIDSGVQIPDGLVIGDDPEFDAKRFRRTDKGICLVTQPMIDRLNS